jgi:hypothetical protein
MVVSTAAFGGRGEFGSHEFHGGFGGHQFSHGFGFHHGFRAYGFPGPIVDFAPWIWWYPPPDYWDGLPGQPYWYYCPSAGSYYPEITTCPEEWVIVPSPY